MRKRKLWYRGRPQTSDGGLGGTEGDDNVTSKFKMNIQVITREIYQTDYYTLQTKLHVT